MESVAIIGMGCRFPGAPNPRAFWQFMCSGGDAITEVPASRYDIDAFYDPRPAIPGKVMSRYGGFLEQVDHFDAAFFGISPREAAKIDPQHRLLMEVAWEAMEDAGQALHRLSAEQKLNIGCFIGVITGDYWDQQFRHATTLDVYATTGSARSGAAGRISFSQGLMGTSFAIDAACSSSLVAIDQAVQNLRAGACTMALAGGVNVILAPDHTIGFSQGKMMAPDGHCKTYDAAADGYVRSEGAGVVVLKLLSQALADGDRIHAVIRGCASNNDGHCESFMAPSTQGQQAGLRKACRNAGIEPLSIDYVEAHGPGTKAGDPIEITTLGEVLCAGRSDDHPLLVGSVKTNIGHTEGAAGVAGFIKVVLCLKHGMIPPNLHFHNPSPDIPWQDYALKIPTELTHLPHDSATPHRAVVCSYGIAGTNTYVVLEEAEQTNEAAPMLEARSAPVPALLPLSAQSSDALQAVAQSYLAHLEDADTTDQSLHDIVTTASLRRTQHEHRLAIICRSRQDAHDKLASFLHGQAGVEVNSGHQFDAQRQKIAWIFPGQGSQWLGMGRDLLAQEPVFRAKMEECDLIMRGYVDWSLLAQLQADEASSRLQEIAVVQPVLFAIEVALATLWRSWGVEPDVVVGHSMGEVAAAYIAGALTLEDATWIICERSKLLLRVSGQGAMAAVDLSLEQAHALVSDYRGRVSVAVNNSPHATVLSGDPEALDEILALLERQGIFGRLVNVTVASHSPQMDPLRADLLALMQGVQPRAATHPMYSTVKDTLITGYELTAYYWVDNLCEPVLFSSAIQALLEDGVGIFMEMSPHPILVGALRQTIEHGKSDALALGSLRRQEDERTALLESLSHLYLRGYEPDWQALNHGKGRHITLPTYPWQRQRYWNSDLERPVGHAGRTLMPRAKGEIIHPILGEKTPSALHPQTFFWTTPLDTELFPYLREHCVHTMPVLPGAAYLELALAAAREVYGSQAFALKDLALTQALFFPPDTTHILQAVLTPTDEGSQSLQFFSLSPGNDEKTATGGWIKHAGVTLYPRTEASAQTALAHLDPEQVQRTWTLSLEAAAYYASLRARGIQHGPLFQGITQIWRRPGEVMARIAIPEDLRADLPGYVIHPAIMDAFLQGITPFLPEEQEEETYVPVAMREVRFYQQPEAGEILWTHATLHTATSGEQGICEGDVALLNERGEILLEVLGFRLQSLGSDNTQEFLRQRLNQLLYTIQWEAQARSEQPKPRVQRQNWLIFGEHTGLGQRLTEQLRSAGASCVTILPGASYQKINEHEYILPPTDPQAFQRLLAEVYGPEGGHACHGIVYLWSLLTTPVHNGALNLTQDLAECGTLHLLQALMTMKGDVFPRLWLVTNGVHAIEGHEEAKALLQAPLWGMGRTIVYEHEHVHTTLIDLSASALPEQAEKLFAEIWSDNVEDEVALRGERRYVARLIRQTLPDKQEQPLFRTDGTYLIVGGLGGVGLRTAAWMVEQGARHLVLLGRHTVPENALHALDALRVAGARVQCMQADVADEQQLARVLDEIRGAWPPLRGVFHSAVVLDDGTLMQLSRERFLGVRPARINGAWNLHKLTLYDPLDYFVLFSSAASLIGSPGQSNYAAASSFLDQLAFYRRQQGYPALCINWGRWGEVGQATREQRGERLETRGFSSMKPRETLTILGALLRQSPPQVGVMSLHLPKWSQFYPHLTRSSLFTYLLKEAAIQQKQTGTEQRLTREMLVELDEEQRRPTLAHYLGEQIARVLGHRTLRLEAHQFLNRLGIDSLMSVELKNRIGADLHVAIPVTTFLQGRTFDQLISSIIAQI